MPSILCLCGSKIDLSEVPNPNGYHLLSEASLEDLIDSAESLYMRAETEPEVRRGLSRLLMPLSGPSPHIYQCQNCGRLAVLRHPSNDFVLQWYSPEDDGKNHESLRAAFNQDIESNQP